ncbi:MAG TPA: rhomboid family intramembrane serine protease [Flavobacteriaceae bacterium]|nr:rhomboid family intramembrane serine protease [Flavobacteriaceae bacterium]
MQTWQQKLRYKYETATMLEKLIGINVVLFVVIFLLKTIAFLFQFPSDFMLEWLVFPKDLSEYIYKPWTIITYAFLHAGIWHILSNMLILYFSGIYFLTYFSPKRLLNYYFLGAIAGALVYMISYNLFPVFGGSGNSYLIGASAAVMAILVGISTHIPNMRVRLMFLGSLKFWWIAAFLVVLDAIQIPFGNPGGHLAHLGGAFLGYVYTVQLKKGNDIGKWMEYAIDWLSRLFSKEKKSPLKTVHRKKKKKSQKSAVRRASNHQEKIDTILDKIGSSGYDSLTKEEKDFLFHAGKDN